jgi:hypothetical protein
MIFVRSEFTFYHPKHYHVYLCMNSTLPYPPPTPTCPTTNLGWAYSYTALVYSG